MKRIAYIISLLLALILFACIEDQPIDAGFEDANKLTIYDYLVENEDEFSSFIAILEKGGIYKTLSA